jgi:hypothetical protein
MTLTTVNAGMLDTQAQYNGFKNRIINGAMVIDQRNAGASVTANSVGAYCLDRYQLNFSQNSKFTVQQNAGSVATPSGFTNYLGITSSSAYSVLSGDYFLFEQPIEGFNTADLGWGAAGAQTVTLSFWVRSSLTGTFGGALANSAQNRSYPFTYTVSAANTWEQKTVTVAGDTTGTWVTNNGLGIRVRFGLGAGSTYSGTAGAWAASNFFSATGATSVVGTNGATFYITGVQLEKGSTATSFDYRPYGTELQLAQRYFQAIPVETYSYAGATFSTTDARATIPLIVSMRVAPTGISTTDTIQFSTTAGTGTGTIAFSKGTNCAVTVVSSGASGLPSAGGCSLLRSSTGVNILQVSVEL